MVSIPLTNISLPLEARYQYSSFITTLILTTFFALHNFHFPPMFPFPSIPQLSHSLLSMLPLLLFFTSLVNLGPSYAHIDTCRSYCGNITIDYPFALKYGCGHPGFRDLLFCINDVLMLHITSGSYRVLEIDYAFQALTLHDPHLSTCDSIVLGGRGNGFVVDPWQAPYLNPTSDNVFLLIGCSAQSALFQGFPSKYLPCRNVSGMSCEDYYRCPAWGFIGPEYMGSVYGSGPPECCAVSFEAIKAINLTKLDCQGYSSAYSLAPLKVDGPHEWSYGIRVKYSLQGNNSFCQACEATGGTCGFSSDGGGELCLCGRWNSTTTCDSVISSSGTITSFLLEILAGIAVSVVWTTISLST